MPGFVSAEVGVSDRLPVGVLDAECLLQFTDGPGRGKTTGQGSRERVGLGPGSLSFMVCLLGVEKNQSAGAAAHPIQYQVGFPIRFASANVQRRRD